MTNWQLFVAAGLPTLTVLLSIWRSDKRADQIEARLDGMDARIDRMDEKIDAKSDGLRAELVSRIDRVAADLKEFYMILGRHDKSIETLEKKQAS